MVGNKKIMVEKKQIKNAEETRLKRIISSRVGLPIFLSVTLSTMLLSGTAIGSINIILLFFSFSIESRGVISMSALLLLGLIFCIINFNITRGSFRCVVYLKIYILFLIFLSLFTIYTYNPFFEIGKTIFNLIQISIGLLSFYLVSSKNYVEMVRVRYDNFIFFKKLYEKNEIEKYKPKKQKVRRKK